MINKNTDTETENTKNGKAKELKNKPTKGKNYY
jgi:hypothetical protein